jgi:hypothetical protein
MGTLMVTRLPLGNGQIAPVGTASGLLTIAIGITSVTAMDAPVDTAQATVTCDISCAAGNSVAQRLRRTMDTALDCRLRVRVSMPGAQART